MTIGLCISATLIWEYVRDVISYVDLTESDTFAYVHRFQLLHSAAVSIIYGTVGS